MYALMWIPYFKWVMLAILVILYYFLYETKKHKWLIAIQAFIFLLVASPTFLDVDKLKGFYTPIILEALFILTYFIVCVLLFTGKIKLYKKVFAGLSLIVLCFFSFYEYLFYSLDGWKDHTEKVFVLNEKFLLRKSFIDYGRPYPYVIEESKYGLFIKYISPSLQISADEELDSVKVISLNKRVLKLKAYSKGKTSNPFLLLAYDWNGKVNRGYIKVSKNNKEGFVDTKLNVVVPLEYNALGDIDGTYECIGYKNNQKGIINVINKTFTPTK